MPSDQPSSPPLRILVVASEVTPFAKSGGLADVMGALPPALRQRGLDVRVLLPRYGWIGEEGLTRHREPLGITAGNQEHWCAVLEGDLKGVPVYFLEHDVLYDRRYLYGPPGGAYDDNCLRFALLSRGALQLCHHLRWFPDLFHVNDWQAALVPVYLNTLEKQGPLAQAATLLTIHNLAYQGWFRNTDAANLDLGANLQQLGLEAFGAINLLKGGIHHATLVSTVSPTYAKEIQTPWYGEGLDRVLRSRRGDLFGVVNGIDYQVWDPATDPLIPRNYSVGEMDGKRFCKAALQQEAGLPERPDLPLIGLVTRLSKQKGLDIMAAALERLLNLGAQVVLLGTGDRWAAEFFREATRLHPRRFHAWITFDERLAHLIEAGSDFFLMPSRWEPCGLNQMYSMRYGTIPIVRATGGLHDTAQSFDPQRGVGDSFKFFNLTPDALVAVTGWAVQVYRERPLAMKALIQRAMERDFTWARAAATYEYLYRLAGVRRAT